MAIYKISYADIGEAKRTRFEFESPPTLTHCEIVALAAQHKKGLQKPAFSVLAQPHTRQLQMAANVQMMKWAEIENVEFIIEGSTHIHCVPSK
ncbi:MAG: hypothetical protein V4634_04985 [Pseudomonadota bacterium]